MDPKKKPEHETPETQESELTNDELDTVAGGKPMMDDRICTTGDDVLAKFPMPKFPR